MPLWEYIGVEIFEEFLEVYRCRICRNLGANEVWNRIYLERVV
ncbi:MAG: hypothetical protein ACRCX8_09930 [Sarcina sp.]